VVRRRRDVGQLEGVLGETGHVLNLAALPSSTCLAVPPNLFLPFLALLRRDSIALLHMTLMDGLLISIVCTWAASCKSLLFFPSVN
jgi:hypothetical protein